jgi:hypothetical protein
MTGLLRTLAIAVTFFYIYSIQFVFVPGQVGTRALIGCAGLLWLIVKILLSQPDPRINKDLGVIFVLIALVCGASLVAVAVNSTSDYSFVTYPISAALIFCAAYFVSNLIKLAYRADTYRSSVLVFVKVVFLQAIIALAMFLSPPINEFFTSLQIMTALDQQLVDETGEFRINGFGARFFFAGIVTSIALLLIVFYVRNYRCNRFETFGLAVAFVVISMVGLMMARTTLIGLALCVPYLFLPGGSPDRQSTSPATGNVRGFLACIALLVGAAVFLLGIGSEDFQSQITPALNFAFELFINYFEQGRLESASTSHLLAMLEVGDGALPLIFGDGLFYDPLDASIYYMQTDVGYLRLLYYFGLPGLLLFFILQFKLIRAGSPPSASSESAYFFTVFFVLVLLLNVKGFTDLIAFTSFLMLVKR